jgi:hypothetical protein
MVNKPRQRGTAWETAVNKYLKPWFPNVHRLPLASPDGDHGGLPVVCEDKDCAKITLADWLKQAEKSSLRAGKPPFVVAKRRGQPVGRAYVICTLDEIIPFWLAYQDREIPPKEKT